METRFGIERSLLCQSSKDAEVDTATFGSMIWLFRHPVLTVSYSLWGFIHLNHLLLIVNCPVNCTVGRASYSRLSGCTFKSQQHWPSWTITAALVLVMKWCENIFFQNHTQHWGNQFKRKERIPLWCVNCEVCWTQGNIRIYMHSFTFYIYSSVDLLSVLFPYLVVKN